MNKEDLISLIKDRKRAPFLFLGSGFTKHYLNTPDWETLLSTFIPKGKHINAYYTQLNTHYLPTVASEIAKECNEDFWDLPENDEYKKSFREKANKQDSVLKDRISKYLRGFSDKVPDKVYSEELELLGKLNIDGIITTNWDDFCERQFPKFNKYIGQRELLFSSSIVNIGEIYKIHGCIQTPESLILTEDDYKDFNDRNTYLAAKLITIFIEHPIVFIGYSMNDPNIQSILTSIVKCLDQENLDKLQNSIFFVDWNRDEMDTMEVERYSMQMEGGILPMIRIHTHDFKPVYECLSHFDRELPAEILRIYKKQFYEIIYSEKPEKKLYVLPETKLENNREIQFVCGFGTISKYQSAVGYTGLEPIDLFRDVVFESGSYDSTTLLTKTIPELKKRTPYIPIYKYLKALEISSQDDYTNNQLGVKIELLSQGNFITTNIKFKEEEKQLNLDSAFNRFPDNLRRTCALIPHLSIQTEELPQLKQFITDHFDEFLISNTALKKRYSTYFKKLICFYDWRKYGW